MSNKLISESSATARALFLESIHLSMIRISFDTQFNSADPEAPEAWRPEASGILRQIADRIDSGEPMPINLFDSNGTFIGRARELSYQPEKPRIKDAL